MERNNEGRADRPNQQHPGEIGSEHPAKIAQAQHKIDIRESELGRNQGQTPADEHIETSLSQIDEATKAAQQSQQSQESETPETRETKEATENTNTAGFMNDETSADRDTGNATGGWEASRTARHK